MPRLAFPLSEPLAVVAALVLVAMAPEAAAQPAGSAVLDQCVADHVAGQEASLADRLVAGRARFRACAQPSCPGPVAQACADLLRELEPRIPSVVPVVREADGRDVVDGALRIDGEALPFSAWGRVRDIDPGAHELVFERTGRVVARQTVVIVEGEKSRRLTLTLAAAAASEKPADPLRIAGWIGLGLGTAALAGGVIFGVLAASEYGDLKDTCAPGCTDDRVSGARSKALAADVLLGSGIAFAAAGGLAVFWPRSSTGAGAEPQAAATPYVVLGPRGAVAGLVVKAF